MSMRCSPRRDEQEVLDSLARAYQNRSRDTSSTLIQAASNVRFDAAASPRWPAPRGLRSQCFGFPDRVLRTLPAQGRSSLAAIVDGRRCAKQVLIAEQGCDASEVLNAGGLAQETRQAGSHQR
jgi:hypothetical protein